MTVLNPNPSSLPKLLAGVFALIALTIFLVNKESITVGRDVSGLLTEVKIETSKPVSGFSLIDHNDNRITREFFLGHWTFVFFGFTNCPDVCPATLTQLVQINKMINKQSNLAGKFQTLFVSVDPDRDSTKHIKDFVSYFDSGFVGVTGEMNNIIAFEKQFGAFHVVRDKSQENYNVGHTSSVYLVNPAGMYNAKFSPPMEINMVLQQVGMLVQGHNNL